MEGAVLYIGTQIQNIKVRLTAACHTNYKWICVIPLSYNGSNYPWEQIQADIRRIWNSSNGDRNIHSLHEQITTTSLDGFCRKESISFFKFNYLFLTIKHFWTFIINLVVALGLFYFNHSLSSPLHKLRLAFLIVLRDVPELQFKNKKDAGSHVDFLRTAWTNSPRCKALENLTHFWQGPWLVCCTILGSTPGALFLLSLYKLLLVNLSFTFLELWMKWLFTKGKPSPWRLSSG